MAKDFQGFRVFFSQKSDGSIRINRPVEIDDDIVDFGGDASFLERGGNRFRNRKRRDSRFSSF